MKKVISASAIAVASLLVLAGCSSDYAVPAETVTVIETPDAPAPDPVLTAEQQMVDNARSFGNATISGFTDDQLLTLGYQTCGILDGGYTVYDIIDEFAYSGQYNEQDMEGIGLIIGSAVAYLCPEYGYQIEAMY